jgi:hypothetical protein
MSRRGCTHVHQRAFEEVRPHVEAGADEQPAGRGARDGEAVGRGQPARDQRLGHAAEVFEGVLLGQELALLLVPVRVCVSVFSSRGREGGGLWEAP